MKEERRMWLWQQQMEQHSLEQECHNYYNNKVLTFDPSAADHCHMTLKHFFNNDFLKCN